MAVLPPTDWRVGCAWVPDFAVQVARLARPDVPEDCPVALVEETKARARVVAACPLARADGVLPGQMANRARARLPGLRCLPWDASSLLQAARALGERLEAASPTVVPQPEDPGWVWVDARGMRWLGGEPGLGARLLAAADGFGQLRLAIADAAVTARAAVSVAGKARLRILPPGSDGRFLAELPLSALALDAELVATLSGLGFERVGALLDLPAAALEARFGPAARAALARALGHDWRRPERSPAAILPETVLALESPVSDTARLLSGLRGGLDTLAGRLISQGISATSLALVLRLDDGTERVEILQPAQPLHHPRPLFELCRDRLERLEVDAPVVELRLQVRAAQASVPEQTHLGATRWDALALEAVLDRLQGRYGCAVVFAPEPVDDVRPERAGRWAAVTAVPHTLRLSEVQVPLPPPQPVRRALSAGPTPLAVQVDSAGTPQAMWHADRWRPVRAFGPERVSGGWWTEQPFAHEDWRLAALDAEGGVWWVRRLSGGEAQRALEGAPEVRTPWRMLGCWD
jgi:protein ImuB